MSSLIREALQFPEESRSLLEPYLPPQELGQQDTSSLPFTTLTYATSLDSQIALSPGAPTALSGPLSKAMTHFLRSRHDAILIGVGTAVADNPSLNCRIEGVGGYGSDGLQGQPRPIIIDPTARWEFTGEHKIFQLVRDGKGRAPYIITRLKSPPADKKAILESYGGKFIKVAATVTDLGERRLEWKDVLTALRLEGLKSVMIEGGAVVINSLLIPENRPLISSLIITLAPIYLGRGGVIVSPHKGLVKGRESMTALRLDMVKWYPFGEDVVLCGKVKLH